MVKEERRTELTSGIHLNGLHFIVCTHKSATVTTAAAEQRRRAHAALLPVAGRSAGRPPSKSLFKNAAAAAPSVIDF